MMFDLDHSTTWDDFDAYGITLDLTIMQCDSRGVLAFYEFEVPYGWLQRKLRDKFNTNYKVFQDSDSYFEDAEKIYIEAKSLDIVKNFRMI